MYYRVAIQGDVPPTWQWKSTALSSLNIMLQWLQFYRVFPQERLRIFFSSSREALNEQLVRENQGLASSSISATQFLQERMIAPRGNERTAFMTVESRPSTCESITSSLEKRREEFEQGAGGDHDLPYRFTLPTSLPQLLAWVKLLWRVQQGDLQREVVACGERQQ